MGVARFFYQNMITAAMLTISSERSGPVGTAVKVGTGSAVAASGGGYTGTDPVQYVIEIDSIAGGAEVGQATFRWRRSDQATWSATGVLTSTSPVSLELGVSIQWTSGPGADFVLADYWTITVDAPWGRAKLLDRDRDTEWRSSGLSTVTIDVDFGSPLAPDVIALLDHNLTSAATITIMANSTPSWTSPPLSETIVWQAGNVLRYLTTVSRSYRYWRLSLSDPANPDGYLRLSELFLGGYLGMSQNFDRGWSRSHAAHVYGPSGGLRLPRGIWATAQRIQLNYLLMTAADRTALWALFDTVCDPSRGTIQPFLVNCDTDDPSDVSLYEWEQPEAAASSPYLSRFNWPLGLLQRVRLARSGA